MADEQVESSTTTEETTVAAESSTETVDASAETKTTEATETPSEHMIPKSRLDEVIQQREDLKEKVSELEKPAEEPAAKGEQEDAAPAHLNERDRVRWYVENDSRKMIEKELGVSLEAAKTLLATSRVTATSDADRRWREGCGQQGLDPTNREVQEIVLGLTKVGVTPDDAFKRVGKMGVGKVKTTEETNTPSATVENTGVTNVMTGKESYASNTREAVALAAKGIRAKQLSSQELIEQAMKRESAGR